VKSNYFTRTCQTVAALAAALVWLSAAAVSLAAQSSAFAAGLDLFRRSKDAEAVPYLESAVKDDPANLDAWLCLGVAYQNLGQADRAIDSLKKGLAKASGGQAALFAYNIGNAYYSKGAKAFAEQFYGQAIASDAEYAAAYLNRGNARIGTEDYAGAAADYKAYLVLKPTTPQRPQIEKVIALIEGEAAAAERQRQAVAAAAQAEADRRKQLLDEVAASLQAAAEETRGLSAGAEDVIQYSGDFVLE
jgi:tetratricopeptide (TPR) repeat protein